MENARIFIWTEDISQVLPVGVGNKDLPEIIALYHGDYSLYALAIQPVENIVEKEYRLADIQSLREFHSQHEGSLLALRADLLERVFAEPHVEIVFVDTL